MPVETAYKKAMETIVKWIETELNLTKTQVFFRTFAPVHFRFISNSITRNPKAYSQHVFTNICRGGVWNTGGHCHLETLPDISSSLVPPETWEKLNTLSTLVSSPLSLNSLTSGLQVLNITDMSARRKDGHSSVYYVSPPAPLHRQDCSHWCLPGVPDTWNELMYAFLMKREMLQNLNSSVLQAQT